MLELLMMEKAIKWLGFITYFHRCFVLFSNITICIARLLQDFIIKFNF